MTSTTSSPNIPPNTHPITLITGASRGLGKAIAEQLAQQGNTVIGTATTQEGADAITKHLSAISPQSTQPIKSCGKVLRQENEDSVTQLFKELAEQNSSPLVLVANAGITADNLILRMKAEEWQRVMDVNLTGSFLLCKHAVKAMIKARWGRIIFIGSVVGSIGNLGQANYSAAKAGLSGLCKSLAREFASRNITANLIAPGFIETDMTDQLDEKIKEQLLANIPLHRYGKPHEIAAAASFLASNGADYITGQTLHINGGMAMN